MRNKPPPLEAIKSLTTALKDVDVEVRYHAAWGLAEVGAEAKPDVKALIVMLTDPEERCRVEAANALGRIGPTATPATAALLLALKDVSASVRREAAGALGKVGSPELNVVKSLIEVFEKDPDSMTRRRAAEALGRLGPAATSALPALIRALKDPDSSVRSGAAGALGCLGPGARPAVSPLTQLLARERDGHVRIVAAKSLLRLEPQSETALKAFEDLLNWDHERVREITVQTLGELGPVGKPAIPLLLDSMRHGLPRGIGEKSAALFAMGADRKELAGSFTQILQRATGRARLEAAQALLNLNPDSPEAIAALVQEFNSGELLWNRLKAARSLASVGPKAWAAIPALRLGLQDKYSVVRWSAARALQQIDSKR
jgi:HEAT repeat protein